MTITAAVTVLAAFLATVVTAIAVQAHWTATQKRIASGIVALVLGTLAAIATNQIDGLPPEWGVMVAKWLVVVASVAALAQGAYAQFKGLLTNLEQATTITPATVTPTDDGQDGSTEGTAGLDDSTTSDTGATDAG